jgi:hypothetical protein
LIHALLMVLALCDSNGAEHDVGIGPLIPASTKEDRGGAKAFNAADAYAASASALGRRRGAQFSFALRRANFHFFATG